jgi:Tfp pilus assembly protein FimT
MVVVVIIAILATIAVPLFASRIRQRAVQQTAGAMAELYRGARSRALGRGAAVMVTTNPTTGAFTVFEAVKSTAVATAQGVTNCGALPTRGCSNNTWVVGTDTNIGTARNIGGIAANTTDYTTTVAVGGAAQSTAVNVCFSPGGRAFVNTGATNVPGDWRPLTDVVVVTLAANSRTYPLVVLPNGTARLGL